MVWETIVVVHAFSPHGGGLSHGEDCHGNDIQMASNDNRCFNGADKATHDAVGPLTELRCKLRRNGYPPLPCSGKRPVLKDWARRGWTADEAEIARWRQSHPDGTNTGLLCGELVGCDIDILDADLAARLEALAIERLGATPLRRVGKAPKVLLCYRAETPFAKAAEKFRAPGQPESDKTEHGVEMLAKGQQMIAYGVHPQTRSGYRWTDRQPTEIPLARLPVVTEQMVRGFLEEVRVILLEAGYSLLCDNRAPRSERQARPGGEPVRDREPPSCDVVAEAFEYIPNDDLPCEDWIRLLTALKHALGEEGWPIAEKWSGKAQKNDPATTERRWQQLRPRGEADGGVTVGTIYDQAKRHGWVHPNSGASAQSKPEGGAEQVTRPGARDERWPAEIAELNAKYAVIKSIGGKCRVLTWEPSPINQEHQSPQFQTFGDFRNSYMNRSVWVGKRPVTLGQHWLEHRGRRQYEGLVFVPVGPPEIDGRLNLWRGWGVEPRPGNWSLMQAHLREVLAGGDPECESYILNWAAWAVQNPGKPAEVALVLRGGEGTGKGVFGRALRQIFGQHGVHISSAQHLVGRFNRHFLDCCYLFADEALWPGDHSAEGALKRLLTEPTLHIEPKGIDGMEVPNRLHVFMASNNDWVVPAGRDARRFAVFDVSDAHQKDEAYFAALYGELERGGLAAMLHDLLSRELSGWHPRRIVQTAALADQKARTRHGVDALVERLATDGVLPSVVWQSTRGGRPVPLPHVAGTTGESEGQGFYAAARTLVPGLKFASSIVIANELRLRWKCNTGWKSNSRRGIAFPPLAELRQLFDARHGPQAWPEQGSWEAPDTTDTDEGTSATNRDGPSPELALRGGGHGRPPADLPGDPGPAGLQDYGL